MAMNLDFASQASSLAAPAGAGFVTPAAPASPATTGGGGFAAALGAAMSQVEAARNSANAAANDLLANGKGDVHTVALAAQQADIALEMFQQVRNKFVQAYQEIMKMPM